MTSSSVGDSGLVELSSSLVAAGNGATLDVDLEALPTGLGLPFLRTFGVSAASDPAFLAALRVKGIIYITKGGGGEGVYVWRFFFNKSTGCTERSWKDAPLFVAEKQQQLLL